MVGYVKNLTSDDLGWNGIEFPAGQVTEVATAEIAQAVMSGNPGKFQAVDAPVPPVDVGAEERTPSPDFERMTKGQIADYALDREILLDETQTKAEMIEALESALFESDSE